MPNVIFKDDVIKISNLFLKINQYDSQKNFSKKNDKEQILKEIHQSLKYFVPKNISKWKKKGIVNYDGSQLKTNLKATLILPDGKIDTPTYLVFENYEKILKWNRSLRFGITVCTLAKMIKI